MRTFLKQNTEKLDKSLAALQTEKDPFRRLEMSVNLVKEALLELRLFLLSYLFIDPSEEIWFFKEGKPELVGLLIYYEAMLHISIRRPLGNRKRVRRFLENELNYFEHFYDYNAEFHLYYVTGQNRFDHLYFMRQGDTIPISPDTLLLDTDPRLSTGYDLKVARIIAYERLSKEIGNELDKLKSTPAWLLDFTRIVPLQWTDPKNGLVELIYSVAAAKSFNHGEVDIKQITVYFEKVFHVRLGNFYKTFEKNRIREGGMTRFLDHLKAKLLEYIGKLDIFKRKKDE